jgi:hypothetical protein
MLIAAPVPLVFAALTDYDNFAALSNRYTESRFVEPAADGTTRIYTRLEGCVWFFCRSVARYARLETTPPTRIVATVEPEVSDVTYGLEVWELSAVDGQTRVLYSHDMDPDFWVPPVLGVWAIRRSLANDADRAARRIEQFALEQEVTRD